MTKLDETGLEAARCAQLRPYATVADIIRAYLAATRRSDALRDLQRMGQECEREADRLAVVTNALGQSTARYIHDGWKEDRDWMRVHAQAAYYGFSGPFRRQIVRCHLLRPEPVAEVEGAVEDE